MSDIVPVEKFYETHDRITDLVLQYMKASRAERTLKTYKSSYRVWAAWCAKEGIDPVPVTGKTIARFVADNAERYKAGTLQTHMAAIATLHKLAGYDTPCSVRAEPLRSVWEGVQKTHGLNIRRVDPVLADDLRLMCTTLEDSLLGSRDKAMLLVGFAGAFRRSELVSLNVGDISYDPEGMKINVRKSKTDQKAEGAIVGVMYGSDPLTCPVRSLKSWLADSGISSGPIFRKVDRHGNIADSALTGKSVALVIKRTCEKCGINPKNYSGHSMRAGFVTEASKNGVSDSSILRHARQQNIRTMLKYIRHGSIFTANPTDKIGL